MTTALPEGITLSLALVQRPGPLSANIFEMAIGALRGHWGFLGDQRKSDGTVLLEGCFPTAVAEVERIEALCKACADFGCRAEMKLGDRRGAIIVLSALGS